MKKKQFLIWLLIILILFSVFIYFNKKKEHFSIGSQEATFTRDAINVDTRRSVEKLHANTDSLITLSDIQEYTSINEYVEDNKISVENLSYFDTIDVDNYCKSDDNCDDDKMCYNNIIQIGDDNNLTFGNINVLDDISLDGWEGYLDFAITNHAVNDGICINKPDPPIIYHDRMTEELVKKNKQETIDFIIKIDQFLKGGEVYFLDNTFFTIIKLKINELDFRTIEGDLNIDKISSFYYNISNLLISLNYHITENIFKFLIYMLERIDELKVNINEDAIVNNLLNLTQRINNLKNIIFNNETNYGINIYMDRVDPEDPGVIIPVKFDTAIDNAINHLRLLEEELLDILLVNIENLMEPGYPDTYPDYLNQIRSLKTYIINNSSSLVEFKNHKLVNLSTEMNENLLFLKGKLEDWLTLTGALGGGGSAAVGGVGVVGSKAKQKKNLAELKWRETD